MDHAIVVGGSMSGLLAARVLADHYEQVTIVEPDRLTPAGTSRGGVAQGRGWCALLSSDRPMLDELFPGIADDLIADGAMTGDIVGRPPWIAGLLVNGLLLEATIRDRVVSLSNVRMRQDSVVHGLAVHGGRVTGIKVGGEMLPADLVVESTGSDTPRWLEEIGYPRAPEDRIEIGLGQTTRQFHRRRTDLNRGIAVMIYAMPDGRCGGLMIASEGNRWTVTLASRFGAYPPALDGFIEFARMGAVQQSCRTLLNAEPVEEPAATWFPASLRRRYEKLDAFPEGFLVLGDDISSVDPVFGQGMSSAAMQGAELAKTLAEGREGLARRFFPRVAKIDGAGADLHMREKAAPRSARVDLANWYLSKLHTALLRVPDRQKRTHSRFGPGSQYARIA